MDERTIRKIIQEEIGGYMSRKQFNVSKIPKHEHNGTDSSRIRENNLLSADNFIGSFVMGNDGDEVFTISKIPNLSLVKFYGVATNGAFGGGPYDEKASVSGEIKIGKLYQIDTQSGTDYYSSGSPLTNDYYQACTSHYNKVSTGASFVRSASDAFVSIYDGTSTVASASVTSIKDNSLQITVDISSNWYIQGFFFLS